MKFIIIILSLGLSARAFSQVPKSLSEHRIVASFGISKHGTGDMKGYVFNTEYSSALKKKWSFILGFGGTVHDGELSLIYIYPNPGGNEVDGSIRYTTAGIQIKANFGYDLYRSIDHQIQLKAGPLLRYQSSSYYDAAGIFYPAAGTGFPVPVVVFNNTSPQRTIALGGNIEISYDYSITSTLTIGASAGLQTDTNGDTITHGSLSIGRRF